MPLSTSANGVKIPSHIAIIMDGNGRWARSQGLRRIMGHKDGANTVHEIVTECARIGVNRLTLYAFSRENWKRPRHEIYCLMRLLKRYLIRERENLMEQNIRLTAIGRTKELPATVRKEMERSVEMSKKNTGMILCLALSYAGRTEIADASRSLARDVLEGKRKIEEIDEDLFASYLYDPQMKEPDLLIRTGGDMRISNFLLWHISYTELWVTPTFWPDFTKELLWDAMRDFSKRERRFGGV